MLQISIIASMFLLLIVLAVIHTFLRKRRIKKLNTYKSRINNALTLYDCLFIHIHMFKDRFTHNIYLEPNTTFRVENLKDLSETNVVFDGESLEEIEHKYPTSSLIYREALERYRLALSFGADVELRKII